uniref:Uncharacterized protein n=1 Tax=Romanomermis culicivorax TaxID=13658 RepID=A0A915K1S4_ROMCU
LKPDGAPRGAAKITKSYSYFKGGTTRRRAAPAGAAFYLTPSKIAEVMYYPELTLFKITLKGTPSIVISVLQQIWDQLLSMDQSTII